ncbi:replication factor C subunit 1 [Kwoniella heveanensis BCC8398]|uniref:Replication factor C subunit 1 n=1 Tax=Kwoniella heveanensis BCC8398 TaxID=1296120 RepID=A0A1B9GYU5_9TREE|nr:replication factor C subunit 1 [Kwoniella heveanensis BCC8398]
MPSSTPNKSTTRGTTDSPKKNLSQSQNHGQSQEKKKPAPAPKKEEKPAGRDIRGFFGAGAAKPSSSTPTSASKNGSGKKPITIDDSDDEEVVKDRKPALSKPLSSTTRTSKHFASSATRKPIILDSSDEDVPPPQPAVSSPKILTPTSRSKPSSAAAASSKRKALVDSESEEEEAEIIKPAKKRQSIAGTGARASATTTTTTTNRGGKKPSYAESESDSESLSEEDVKPKSKAKPTSKKKKSPSPMDVDVDSEPEDDFIDDDEDDLPNKAKSKAKPKAASAKKPPPAKKAGSTGKEAKKEEPEDGVVEKKKPSNPNWRAAAAARSAGPKNPGSKEIPEGAPDCLAGLTFVFTGELESLGRDEAQELVKRYSGKVTGAPSGRTSFVVVGENAGASKLAKIKEKKIATMTEDEFFEFIRSRRGDQLDEKQVKAREAEEKKIQQQAAELEKREKEEERDRKRKERALEGTGIAQAPASAQLWTTKYAPQNLKEICGNKAPVERLGQWLKDWWVNYQSGFKKPGKDGMGIYRAVLISGPPGIGKTTSAHLMAKEAGYKPIELNASDARSKKLVENSTNIDNASLDGFFQGSGIQSTTVADVRVDSRSCLIMDEVDGMSAGDRGGVGALNVLIKKTRIPMILICNDRSLQKMKPLQSTTFNMTFRRPGPAEIRSRIMSILFKEKLKIPANVVDELVKGVNSDIRQVLNMLSTFKLSKDQMDFDEGKELVKLNEKNTIMTPFTIIDKLTGPYAFSKNSKETLGDRMELYFHDFSFIPLFMQEHYLKTNPTSLNTLSGPEQNLKHLELVSKAADSISDGDLIDRMIHGSEQQWSLLPVHAVASTVRPASLIYGSMRSTGGPGGWGPSFPQWLGQNSKMGKLQRQLTDIQIRMRLRVSGSRAEIREQYMPMLAAKIVLPLTQRGTDAVEETIEYMDEYFLGKEDWDAFVELGVDTMSDSIISKKIPTATKTAFTKQYNKSDHPIAFHKGDMFAASKKKIADDGPAPDNEEVFEEDEPVPDEPSEKEDDDEEVNNVTKDKLIKAVKPKGAAAKGRAKK